MSASTEATPNNLIFGFNDDVRVNMVQLEIYMINRMTSIYLIFVLRRHGQ